MCDRMNFPKTPEEFIKIYSFIDKEEIYTNGVELIPVFRVEQMLYHYIDSGICKNVAEDYDDCDQFICSKCGIELQHWFRVERDEDDGDETHHEYVFRYCPNCGAKVTE